MGNCYYYLFLQYVPFLYNLHDILLQSSSAEENYEFTRWVDPRPIYPHAEYIYYLQDHIFDLEREVSSGYKDDEQEDDNNGASS